MCRLVGLLVVYHGVWATDPDSGFSTSSSTLNSRRFSFPLSLRSRTASTVGSSLSFPPSTPTGSDSGVSSRTSITENKFTFARAPDFDSGAPHRASTNDDRFTSTRTLDSDSGVAGSTSDVSDKARLGDMRDWNDVSFIDDIVFVNADNYNINAPPNDVSKIIFENYEFTKGTEMMKRAWRTTNVGAPEKNFVSITGMYAPESSDGPDVLFLYHGKAYACRAPPGGKVADAVSDGVFELYSPDNAQLRPLYIHCISILDHLIDESSDVSRPAADFAADVLLNPPQTDPPRESDTFHNLFKRLQVRGYGWVFLEDQIPVPLYKFHVSTTRISSFRKEVTRTSFFTDKLKIPWAHLVDKFRTSRQRIVINSNGDTRSTLDNAATRFWDRIAAKAFPDHRSRGYWKKLVNSFGPGTDSLQLVKHSNYYSNLMPGGRLPLTGGMVFFKAGPRVTYDGKVTLKIARNSDGSFNVNYSFLRGWDIKAVLAVGVGIKTLKGFGGGLGALIVRPYKNQQEWNFVRSGMSPESAASVLESFADNTLTDVKKFTGDWTGNWRVFDGADVSSGLGIGYNLLKGKPSVTFAESSNSAFSASFGTEVPLLFGNVAVTRTRQRTPTDAAHMDTKWTVSATAASEHTIQTYWTIEPFVADTTHDDGVIARIKGDTEDSGHRGVYASSTTLNTQSTLLDLVTKKNRSPDSLTLNYKPTFYGRGYPQFTNPVRKMFGSAFYDTLLFKAQEVVEQNGHDFDKRILSFNIEYALSDEAKQHLLDKYKSLNLHDWEARVDREQKAILKKPEKHREKLVLDVSVTASKTYKKGGTFAIPFLGRQRDGAEITVSQEYPLFTKFTLPFEFLIQCKFL